MNFEEMEVAVGRLDQFNLTRTPNFEPRRGPLIPHYYAAPQTPLLFMPVKGAPEESVLAWLAALDGNKPLQKGFTQKSLRQWKRQAVGHRSFTVIRHPLARAHTAFCDHILGYGPATFGEIRDTLRKMFKIPLPKENPPNDSYGIDQHRDAFMAFLSFLKANLQAQTSVRIDASWASQAAVVQGFANFAPPDMILREDRLAADLAFMAYSVGRDDAADFVAQPDPHGQRLAGIYDARMEEAAQEAYQRDYMTFGFGNWR